MIVRLVVVDPHPRKDESDLIVYQVPEHSRAYELLVEMLEEKKLEHVVIKSPPKVKAL